MENKEMAYRLALLYLESGYKKNIIALKTYELLLQKINEKYAPIVPLTKAI